VPEKLPIARLLAGLALALAVMAAVSALAHLPVGAARSDAALRVALRTARARVEVCRDLTAAELAALPAHMRQPRTCAETAVDYRLTVSVDGAPRLERRLAHRGVRRTRPLVAEELLPLPAGAHRVRVTLEPLDPPPGAENLPRPVFDQSLEFAAGRIRLLAYDDDTGLRLDGGA
jgi:hypothetical protein